MENDLGIPDHDHINIPREFKKQEFHDDRTPEKIVVDAIAAEAMQYVQSMNSSKQELSADAAWCEARDIYEYLESIDELPMYNGKPISLHMYQAYFMLAFELEELFDEIKANNPEFNLEQFMSQADEIAMKELAA
jgi:hypothetical protein